MSPVVDPVVAPFYFTHTNHSFIIVIDPCCNTLIEPTSNPMINSRYVVVADTVAARYHQTHTHHSFTVVIESCENMRIGAQ
jgi:hypothetical protein